MTGDDARIRGELLAMLRPHAIDAVARFEHATSPPEADAAAADMKRLKAWMDWLAVAEAPQVRGRFG